MELDLHIHFQSEDSTTPSDLVPGHHRTVQVEQHIQTPSPTPILKFAREEINSSELVVGDQQRIHEISNPPSSPPHDNYHMVTIMLFLQGMGELFPWNAMLSAVDYLLALYHEQKVMLWMTSVYSIFTLLALFILIKYGVYVSYIFKIYIPYALLIVLLIIVPLLYVVINDRQIEFYILLVLVAIMAVCTGCIQSALYGLSSKLPHHYMNTVISGSACAGLFINCLRILTKVTIESGYEDQVPISVLSISTIISFS